MLSRITKISASPHANIPVGNWKTYIPGGGMRNGESLPMDYEVLGYMLTPLQIGGPMTIFRVARNGIVAAGILVTSRVKEIEIRTENSIYRINTP